MKRKVEYIVMTVDHLKKNEKLEDKLKHLKAENRYHYVVSPKGKLINLRDAEQNNPEDTRNFEVQCIHLLCLMPYPNAFNVAFYLLFQASAVSKRMNELTKLYPEAKSVNEESFYDGCFKALELKYLESKIDLIQIQAKLNDIQLYQLENIRKN